MIPSRFRYPSTHFILIRSRILTIFSMTSSAEKKSWKKWNWHGQHLRKQWILLDRKYRARYIYAHKHTHRHRHTRTQPAQFLSTSTLLASCPTFLCVHTHVKSGNRKTSSLSDHFFPLLEYKSSRVLSGRWTNRLCTRTLCVHLDVGTPWRTIMAGLRLLLLLLFVTAAKVSAQDCAVKSVRTYDL